MALVMLGSRQTSFRPHSNPSLLIQTTREFCRLKTDLSTVGKSRHVKLQNLVALGILDAYRREQAMADAQKASASNAGADEETCPAECVRDIYSVEDLDKALEDAGGETLVVVDFFKTSCGSCRYIQPGFVKLCRASEERHSPVMFLRHNIFDEYEELSDLSEKFKIRAVPLFYFFKNGEVVEKFATRERRRIAKAINEHAGYEVLDPHS